MKFNLHSSTLSFRSEIFLPWKFQIITLENAQVRLARFIATLCFVKVACIYNHVLKAHGHAATKDWKHKRLFAQSCKSACSRCNCVCLYLYAACIHNHRFWKWLGLIAVKIHLDLSTWHMFPFLLLNTVVSQQSIKLFDSVQNVFPN